MALALNKSEEVLVGKNKSLADFTYDDSEMAQLFKKSLSEVKFLGFSVRDFLCRKLAIVFAMLLPSLFSISTKGCEPRS